jgi:hypothetical protein
MRLSIGSLTRLCKDNPNSPERDGLTIMRTIYDAHLQALYILKDPARRAKQYEDFYWIDWHRFVGAVTNTPGKMFQSLAASKKRAENEPQMLERYRLVEAAYRRGQGHRRDWYEGSLEDMAKEVGYEGECRVLSRLVNPAIHSSAYGLRGPGGMNAITMLAAAWHFFHRCLGRVVEHEGLIDNIPKDVVETFITPSYATLFEIDDATLQQLRNETEGDAAE